MSQDSQRNRRRLLPALAGRDPWWLAGLLGVAAVLLGIMLITRPLSSLGVLAIYLGLGCIVTGLADVLRKESPSWSRSVLGLAWIVLGILLLAWVGRAVTLLPLVLSVALIISGVARWWSIRDERTWDGRIAAGLFGLADVIAGVLALAWPDVTLLFIAALFGARTILFGLAQIGSALTGGRETGLESAHGNADAHSEVRVPRRSTWARMRRTTAAVLAAALTLGAWALS